MFDDEDAVVGGDEGVEFGGEGIGADAEVVGFDMGLAVELVAGLDDGPVAAAEGDDADGGAAGAFVDGRGDEGFGGVELAGEAEHVVLVVVGTFGVLGALVMAAATGEVGGGGVVGAGEGAVGYGVAVDVFVAGEAAELFKLLRVENFAAGDRGCGVVEGLGHPVVHAEVEVREDEDGGLELLGEIEGLDAELEALFDGAGEEDDVFGVAVREAGDKAEVGLGGAGGKAGGGAGALDVEDDAGDFGVVAEAGELGHKGDSGAGGGGHGTGTSPSCAEHHADGGELVFGLNDGEGGFAVGFDAMAFEVADELFDDG